MGQDRSFVSTVALGAAAGLGATAVQTTLGLAIDKLLLPDGHDNNVAPRLVNRLFRRSGLADDAARDWTMGTVFHFGYAVSWGAVYALARRWSGLPGLVLGPAFAGLLYLLAFSRLGGATLTEAERPPDQRPWGKQASLVAIASSYALAVAVLMDRLDGRRRGSRLS
jgi:hypothetical protein